MSARGIDDVFDADLKDQPKNSRKKDTNPAEASTPVLRRGAAAKTKAKLKAKAKAKANARAGAGRVGGEGGKKGRRRKLLNLNLPRPSGS